MGVLVGILAAGETSNPLNVSPAPNMGHTYPIRVVAIGGFGVQEIVIDWSPTVETDDWVALTTTLADDESLVIDAPVERIRARAPAGMTGNATIYAIPNA